MTAASNFISLEQKVRELLLKEKKNKKIKEKRKTVDQVIGQKGANFAFGPCVSWQQLNESWFKVSTVRHGVNKRAQVFEYAA